MAPTDDPTKPTATPTTAPTEGPTPDPSGYSIRYENGKAVVNAPSGKYAVIFAAYDSNGKAYKRCGKTRCRKSQA